MIKRILALCMLALLFTAPAWADSTTVTNTADLQGALANELFDTINIAPGIYVGCFTVTHPVKLIGNSGSKPILDGGALGTVLTITGAEVTLRDLIIQNGNARYGAAVYTSVRSSITAEGCTFRNNDSTDASLYSTTRGVVCVNRGCTATFTDCDFTGNTVMAGDGICLNSMGHTTLTNCSFSGNTNKRYPTDIERWNNTGYGGAACFEEGTAVITNCSFTNNRSEGIAAGVSLEFVESAVLQGCEFKNNSGDSGVALRIRNEARNITVTDCDFTGNKVLGIGVPYAGAVDCNAKTIFKNCAFVDNGGAKCELGGAVLFSGIKGNSSTLINCLFTGNSALEIGEYPDGNPQGIGGAYYAMSYLDGDYIDGSYLTFIHCTFTGNRARTGGEIMFNCDKTRTRFVNCVICHDGDEIYQRDRLEFDNSKVVETPITFDNCAVSPSILATESIYNCPLVNKRSCKTISGGTLSRVTYTRPNGHSVEVVQTGGIALEDAGATLTGKALSSIAGEYEVEQSMIETDLTARARDAAAPELGAVNPGDVNPPAPPQVTPPVITSFQVGGFDGSTGLSMVAGRTYTATATATGEGVTWTVEADDALTCSEPNAGNSTTFTVTPNAASDGAKISVRAQNEGGVTQPATLTFEVLPQLDEKEEKAREMSADPQSVDPQGLNISANDIVTVNMSLDDLDGGLRNAVSNNTTTPLAILPELQPQQSGTYYMKMPVEPGVTGDLLFFTGEDSSASDAVFYDENWNEITSVDSSVVIIVVAAPLEAGKTYTPVIAAENGEGPQPVRPDNGSHSSGCNGGFGVLSLLPLLGLFVLKKK